MEPWGGDVQMAYGCAVGSGMVGLVVTFMLTPKSSSLSLIEGCAFGVIIALLANTSGLSRRGALQSTLVHEPDAFSGRRRGGVRLYFLCCGDLREGLERQTEPRHVLHRWRVFARKECGVCCRKLSRRVEHERKRVEGLCVYVGSTVGAVLMGLVVQWSSAGTQGNGYDAMNDDSGGKNSGACCSCCPLGSNSSQYDDYEEVRTYRRVESARGEGDVSPLPSSGASDKARPSDYIEDAPVYQPPPSAGPAYSTLADGGVPFYSDSGARYYADYSE